VYPLAITVVPVTVTPVGETSKIEARYVAIVVLFRAVDVRDEYRGTIKLVVNREIPGVIELLGQGRELRSVTIDDQQ